METPGRSKQASEKPAEPAGAAAPPKKSAAASATPANRSRGIRRSTSVSWVDWACSSPGGFGDQVLAIGPVLILIVVAMFLAAGLNPAVEWLVGHRFSRAWAVVTVIVAVLLTFVLFLLAIVPVITDQVTSITEKAPGWLDDLLKNKQVQEWDRDYDLISKIKDYISAGGFAEKAFGGALGLGLAALSLLGNAFVVIVLMLYFLSSLPKTKAALYQLAPASRRDRVSRPERPDHPQRRLLCLRRFHRRALCGIDLAGVPVHRGAGGVRRRAVLHGRVA